MSSVLDKIYKNSEEVKDRVESIDDTLQRLYKTEVKENKAEDKERKEKALKRKRSLRQEKRSAADKTKKGLFGALTSEEKKKEGNVLMDIIKGALGGVFKALSGSLGMLGSILTNTFTGLGLGAILGGALSKLSTLLLNPKTGLIAAAYAVIRGSGDIQNAYNKRFSREGKTKTGIAYTREDIADFMRSKGGLGNIKNPQVGMAANLAGKMREAGDFNDKAAKSKEYIAHFDKLIASHKKAIAEGSKDPAHANNIKVFTKQRKKANDNLYNYLAEKKKLIKRIDELYGKLDITDQELIDIQIESGRRARNNTPDWVDSSRAENPAWWRSFAGYDYDDNFQAPSGYQTGGFTVPGHSTGDNHPYMLPPGSFVLNRNAAQHFQTGGSPTLSPVLLESKEKVLLPGDPMMPIAALMNELKPRFQTAQTGGHIIEYLTGEQGHPNYRADHGGDNYHEHLAFQTTAGRDRAMALLKSNGIKIGSVNDSRHVEGSYHYSDQAFDVGGAQVPKGEEPALSQKVRRILKEGGFSGIGGGGGTNTNTSSSFQENMGGMFQGLGNAGIFASTVMGGIGDFLGQKVFGDGFSLSSLFGGAMGGIGNLFGMGEGKEPGANISGTGPVDMGADVKEQLRRTAQLAIDAGFTKEQAKTMAAIAGGESTFNNTAHNTKGLDNSYGLWQINMHGDMGPERRRQLGLSSNDQLFDPATNARAAKYIFDRQGFGAWGAYTDGNAGKYMNAAQAMQLQAGGITSVHGNRSSLNKSTEMIRAFGEAIAESTSAEPIVIYQDEPQSSVHVATDSSIHQTPPDISTVPSATPAKHYMFYDLNYGPVV